ncbi:MAG: glutaredoxin domain-containing protein [Candidatus Limnocylindrales bacterium]
MTDPNVPPGEDTSADNEPDRRGFGISDFVHRVLARRPSAAPTPLATPTDLTVYGADWCGDCLRAKRHLDAAGVAYRWIDLAQDRDAKEMLTAAGLRSIPVIATADGRILVEPSNAELRVLVESLAEVADTA